MAFESDLGQSGRMASVDVDRGTPGRKLVNVCRFPRKRSLDVNPRKGMGSWDFLPARPRFVLAASPATIFPSFIFRKHRFTLRLRHGRITSSGVGRRRPAAPRTGLRLAAVRQSFGATTRRDLDMGAIAEGLVAYAQPLLDPTDGSEEQLNKAFTISQLCFNLALLPEDSRDTTLSEMRPALNSGRRY